MAELAKRYERVPTGYEVDLDAMTYTETGKLVQVIDYEEHGLDFDRVAHSGEIITLEDD